MRGVLLALGAGLAALPAHALECSTECPPGTRRASFEAYARGEAGVVAGEHCETYCEPTLTCTAPSIPRVSRTAYACEPLEGYSDIPADSAVDFEFARAWDEEALGRPPADCGDGVPGEGEADVDCGGVCLPTACGDGLRCDTDEDCNFAVCAGGRCGGFASAEQLEGAAPWPTGRIAQAAVVDLDGDGDADLVIGASEPLARHEVFLDGGRPVRVETTPLERPMRVLFVRDDRGGPMLAALHGGVLWTRRQAADGTTVEATSSEESYIAAAPGWLGGDDRPRMVSRRSQEAGLVLLAHDGTGWVQEAVVGEAAFPPTSDGSVFTFPSGQHPDRDEVVVVDEAGVVRIPRDAEGAYLWDAPEALGPPGREAFVFAATPGGPLDSVGVFRSADGDDLLDLYVAVADGPTRVERLSRSEGFIGPIAGDFDGRGGLDTGRVFAADLRLTVDRADGSRTSPRFPMPAEFTKVVVGRHDLAGSLLLLGDGRGGILRRATP